MEANGKTLADEMREVAAAAARRAEEEQAAAHGRKLREALACAPERAEKAFESIKRDVAVAAAAGQRIFCSCVTAYYGDDEVARVVAADVSRRVATLLRDAGFAVESTTEPSYFDHDLEVVQPNRIILKISW